MLAEEDEVSTIRATTASAATASAQDDWAVALHGADLGRVVLFAPNAARAMPEPANEIRVAAPAAAPTTSSAPAPAPDCPAIDHPRAFTLAAMGMVTRAGQIAVTLATSGADERFCGHIARADAARDCGDWGLAEAEYAAALRRFPLHWGYCIQYAHAIKEQGRFAHAEIWYRSAVALAAPADAVDEHLAFVCHSSGVAYQSHSVPDLAVPPLLAPPTWHDIATLARLARVPHCAGDDQALVLLRSAADNRAVLRHLLERHDFARANRDFLSVVAG